MSDEAPAGVVSVRQIPRMEDVEFVTELFIGLKSDFYTLFLALAPLAERTPRLTAAEKEAVRAAARAVPSRC